MSSESLPAAAANALAQSPGTAAASAREFAEAKCAIELARSFPRSEEAARAALIKACSREGFAERALYRFPRGGKTVEGPSVSIAREAGRCWGNIQWGFRVVDSGDGFSHIQGIAWDVEANIRIVREDRFSHRLQRKRKLEDGTTVTEWQDIHDERELRELINRKAAILERNALLKILPPDVLEDAVEAVRKTQREGADKALLDREKATRTMIAKLADVGVTVEMIERHIGHTLSTGLTPVEFVELGQIGRTIKDGQGTVAELFPPPKPAAAAPPVPPAPSLGDISL